MVITTREAYEILKLPPNASESDIKAAYKSLALQYHPDKRDPSEREEATKQFQQISLAYKKLTGDDSEVVSLEEKFKDPTFMHFLFCALFGLDRKLFNDNSSSSEEDDDFDSNPYKYINPGMGYGGYYRMPQYQSTHYQPTQYQNMPYERQTSHFSSGEFYKKDMEKRKREAEKIANELIADEERQKQRAMKRGN